MLKHRKAKQMAVMLLLLTMLWPTVGLGEEIDPFFTPTEAGKSVSLGYSGVTSAEEAEKAATVATASPTAMPTAMPAPTLAVATDVPATMAPELILAASEEETQPPRERENEGKLTLTLHAPPGPVLLGASCEVMVTISPLTALSGSVAFTEGESRTVVPVTDGAATLRFVPMAAGVRTLRAQYVPEEDENLTSNVAEAEMTFVSTLPIEGESIAPALDTPAVPLAVRLTASETDITSGETIELTADVWPADTALIPMGTVAFYADGELIATSAVAEGIAALQWTPEAMGDIAVAAAYTPAVGENYTCSGGETGVYVLPAGAVSILLFAEEPEEPSDEFEFSLSVSTSSVVYGGTFTVTPELSKGKYDGDVDIKFGKQRQKTKMGVAVTFDATADVNDAVAITAKAGDVERRGAIAIEQAELTITLVRSTDNPNQQIATIQLPTGTSIPQADLNTFMGLFTIEGKSSNSQEYNNGVITLIWNGKQDDGCVVKFEDRKNKNYKPATSNRLGSGTISLAITPEVVWLGEAFSATITISGVSRQVGDGTLTLHYGEETAKLQIKVGAANKAHSISIKPSVGTYACHATYTYKNKNGTQIVLTSNELTRKVAARTTGAVTVEKIEYGSVPVVNVKLDEHEILAMPNGKVKAVIDGVEGSAELVDGKANIKVDTLLDPTDVPFKPVISFDPETDYTKSLELKVDGFIVDKAQTVIKYDVHGVDDKVVITAEPVRSKAADFEEVNKPSGLIVLNGESDTSFVLNPEEIVGKDMELTYEGDRYYQSTKKEIRSLITSLLVKDIKIATAQEIIDGELPFDSTIDLIIDVTFESSDIANAMAEDVISGLVIVDEDGKTISMEGATYTIDDISTVRVTVPYVCQYLTDKAGDKKQFTATYTYDVPLTVKDEKVTLSKKGSTDEFIVSRVEPDIALTLSTPIYYGQPISARATASTKWGATVTEGGMRLKVSNVAGDPAAFRNSAWSPQVKYVLEPNDYYAWAEYSALTTDETGYADTISGNKLLTVRKASTQVDWVSSTGNWRDGYTITAHIESITPNQLAAAQKPGGYASLCFEDANRALVKISTVRLDASGIATFQYKGESLDGKLVYVIYEGDARYNKSAYFSKKIVDSLYGVALTITPNASSVAYGQSVTLTAEITPGIAKGSEITFYDNGVKIAGTPVITGNKVTLTIRPTLDAHAFTAQYNAVKDDKTPYASNTVRLSVSRVAPLVTLAATPAKVGADLSVRVDAVSGGMTPTGEVVFSHKDIVIGTATLDITGRATMTWKEAPKGTITVAATYQGNTYYTIASAYAPVTVTATAAKESGSRGDPYTVSTISDNEVPLSGPVVRLLNQDGAQLESYTGSAKPGDASVLEINTKLRRTQYTYEFSMSNMRSLAAYYPQGYYDLKAGEFNASVPFAIYNGLPGLNEYLRTKSYSRDSLKLRVTFERVNAASTEAALASMTQGSTLASPVWRVTFELYDALGPIDYQMTDHLSTPIKLRFATSEKYPYSLHVDLNSDTIQLPLAEKNGGEALVEVVGDGEYGLVVDQGMG